MRQNNANISDFQSSQEQLLNFSAVTEKKERNISFKRHKENEIN